MACAVRTVAVLSCGSSEHAERLPIKTDTTIWHVCLKCTLTFISSCTGAKKLTFLQFTRSRSRCSFHLDHVHRPRHGTGRKQVRNLHLSHGGFLTLHVRFIRETFHHFITTLITENSTKFHHSYAFSTSHEG